jgi:outer membrane receptor for monomeric catechols
MNNVRETDPNDAAQDILAGHYRNRGFEVGASGNITHNWDVSVATAITA